jgi:hypothetical protein
LLEAIAASGAYQERLRRFNDAASLRKPDRVPFITPADLFMTRYGGAIEERGIRSGIKRIVRASNWPGGPISSKRRNNVWGTHA